MGKRFKTPLACSSCSHPIITVQDRHYSNGSVICRECLYGDGPRPAQVVDSPAPAVVTDAAPRARVLREPRPSIHDLVRPRDPEEEP